MIMPIMKNDGDISRFHNLFKWLLLLLVIPGYFINLGLIPLISDEPTRGIVTLEMIMSGNYIVPAINGELYLNKPPLFNWIQAGSVFITGSMEEWVFRLPSIIAIAGIAFLIWFASRKYLKDYALVASMSFVVAGRVLFWDSFMGLIDLTYSFVTLASFIWLIKCHQKEKYYWFFIGSYFLAALGYLMKGIPSIAFQGLSLVALLLYDKKFRQLFSIAHLSGIIVFSLIVGGYYFLFGQQHSIESAVVNLISESNRLQDTSGNGGNWWLHLIEFPVNFMIEFAPVTLLLFLLFHNQLRKTVFKDKFFRYLILIFLANIGIYWLSADMRSRYLFMLVPVLIIVLVKAYMYAEEQKLLIQRILNKIIIVASFLISISIMVYPFWKETRNFNNVLLVSIFLTILSLSIWVYGYRAPKMKLLALFGCLLVFRIGFNLYNLPARMNSLPDKGYKEGEIRAAQLTKGAPLYIFGDTPINHDASFYITRERKIILTRTMQIKNPGTFYLVDDKNLGIFAKESINHEVLHSFVIKLNETKLHLVKRL